MKLKELKEKLSQYIKKSHQLDLDKDLDKVHWSADHSCSNSILLHHFYEELETNSS